MQRIVEYNGKANIDSNEYKVEWIILYINQNEEIKYVVKSFNYRTLDDIVEQFKNLPTNFNTHYWGKRMQNKHYQNI